MNSNHYRKLLKAHGADSTKGKGASTGIANVSRRGFLAGVGAGALVLAVGLPSKGFGADAPKYAGEGMGNGLRDDVKLFVAIGADGTVTITNIRAEMGQGIRTGVAIVIADELEADMSKVKVVQAVGNEPKYGNQDTDGSRSTRHHFMAWRRAGAAARTMLEKAAAEKWGVPVSKVEAKNHEVVEKGGTRKAGYGELAAAASAMAAPAPASVKLKSPKAFRYIGKSTNKGIDGMDITTGKATYGQDVRLEGMLYAVIERAPVHGGTIASVDSSATMKVPGVKKVLNIDAAPIPGAFQPKGGVAVIATNTWAAMKGRDALKVKWNDGAHASFNSDKYREQLQAAVKAPGKVVREVGKVDDALSSAKKKVTADYYIPMLAHVPMESPAATARVANGKAEVWACVQGPQAGVDNIAGRLKIPKENVTVHQTFLGGGFGRKSKVDFLVEAALCSQAMDGTPVKVVWTREDDLQHDYYHAVSAEHLEAGLDDAGKVTGWLHRSAAPSLFSLFMPDPKHEQPLELGMGLVDTPFAVANMRMENPEAAAHTRIGWFRAVYNVPHAFAIQSFAAEVAAAAGKDQKDYLLELIGPPRKMNNHTELNDSWNYGEDPAKYPYDTARLRGVIELAAKGAGWGKKLPKGEGMGIAAHRSFATYTAAVFHVKVVNGVLSIPRVDVAIDCGPQVNPDRVKAMMEGSAIMGVAIATEGEITFKDGATQQGNFDSFQVTRMNGAPRQIVVHSVPSASYDAPMGGAGEPGLPPMAPALCNAIFAATGKRIRVLPIRDQLKMA